jgi:hypothetical protein
MVMPALKHLSDKARQALLDYSISVEAPIKLTAMEFGLGPYGAAIALETLARAYLKSAHKAFARGGDAGMKKFGPLEVECMVAVHRVGASGVSKYSAERFGKRKGG